ncbi:MAG: hypothetical protein RL846_32325 [Deltaproteobacteria bacterium]
MRATAILLVTVVATAAQTASAAPTEWKWRQILSVPRIGARLTAIAVDEQDPNRIFVGTQEGTVLRTTDGGVTWRELELRPFVVADRSLGLRAPGLPRLGATTPEDFKMFVDAPDQEVGDRIGISSVANPFEIKPSFFYAGFVVEETPPTVDVLSAVTRSRSSELKPVMRIAICPGAPYPNLDATKRDVYGSYDDGLTFVRLFANPGRTNIDHVLCAPGRPNDVAVATQIGLFRSRDGGLTFDQDLTAWPGQRATAVAYGPSKDIGDVRLYSAAGSELFAGDLDDPNGLTTVYPNDASTAPWLPIWWMATTKEGDVWLATDDGVRRSRDKGVTWETVARTLLSRQAVWQVEVGENEDGGRRVAIIINVQPRKALQNSVIYASDDDGKTWHGFFTGLSRRTFRMMATVPSTAERPAGWWVATSGGIWTNWPSPAHLTIDGEAAAWADDRLSRTESLYDVLQEMLDNLDLSNEAIVELMHKHRVSAWVPRVDMRFEYTDRGFLDFEGQSPNAGINPIRILTQQNDLLWNRNLVYFLFQLSWRLGSLLSIDELNAYTRGPMHELRRQIQFATEDAWHERQQLLLNLSEGLSDPVQVESTKTRIEALEAMMAVWLGRPYPASAAFVRARSKQ